MKPPVLGILGARRYGEEIFSSRRVDVVATAFGDQPIMMATHNGQDVVWIPRFGWDDHTPADQVNHRAMIAAFYLLGVNRVVTLNGFGTMDPQRIAVGQWAVPFDRLKLFNWGPLTMFTGPGWIRVDVSQLFCPEMRNILKQAIQQKTGQAVFDNSVLCLFNGPSQETPAEIEAAVRSGGHLAGTALALEPEFCREAGGICFASLCWASDDCTMPTGKWVGKSAEEIAHVLWEFLEILPKERGCQCLSHFEGSFRQPLPAGYLELVMGGSPWPNTR